MAESPDHNAGFAVMAAPQAGEALSAIGLAPRLEGGWLRAETAAPEVARAALRAVAADWCVRPMDAPRPRLFVSDMDSSIIEQECIDELADFAGRKSEVAAITERAMRGELDFAEALTARVAVLQGLDEDVLQRCRAERVTLRPGAQALTAALRRAGATTALVSGGFDAIVRGVAADCGFDRFHANRLTVQAGALTGGVETPLVDAAAKAAFLLGLAGEIGAAPEETVAMGDGANDVPMMRAAGFAVAVGGKAVALEAADAAVRGGDLSVVAAFLGLTETGNP